MSILDEVNSNSEDSVVPKQVGFGSVYYGFLHMTTTELMAFEYHIHNAICSENIGTRLKVSKYVT